MASFLNILLTIIIATSLVQTFVVGQIDEDSVNDELKANDSSYLRELLNVLLSNWSHHKQESSSEDLDPESSDYVSGENRPSRNLHVKEPSHLCEMTRHLVQLPQDEYEYRPSLYYEMTCDPHVSHRPVYGRMSLSEKKFCYNNHGCQKEYQEITIFRRRRNEASCWEPQAKKISIGCKCKFPHQRLPSLTYTP